MVNASSMRISRDSDSDDCPVPDDLLGALYRSSRDGLPELIATVSPDVRAQLASYCYRRAHLKAIGLAVASTCNESDLVRWGGTAGAALYARSREKPAAPMTPSHYVARQRITLASGALRKNLPIDLDPEPDDEPVAGANFGADHAAAGNSGAHAPTSEGSASEEPASSDGAGSNLDVQAGSDEPNPPERA
jgi:hypothetical protein